MKSHFELPKELLDELRPPRGLDHMTGALEPCTTSYILSSSTTVRTTSISSRMPTSKISLQGKRQSQLFVNAVVALDSAADYLYCSTEHGQQKIEDFLKELGEPALLEVREWANAMKHCKRWNPKKLQAVDVAKPTCDFRADTLAPEQVRLRLEFSVRFFEEASPVVKAAMEFWFEQSRLIEGSRPRFTA